MKTVRSILFGLCLTVGVAGPMLGVSQTAFADGKSKNNAEFVRLTEEMSLHLSKNLYSAADGDFVSAMKLHGITVPGNVFFMGAQAAAPLGHVDETLKRLEKAKKAGHPASDIDGWLAVIKTEYGMVDVKKRKTEERELTAGSTPFDPAKRAAVEFAQKAILETGKFAGRLPLGEYTIGTKKTTFNVEADKTIKVKP